MTDNEHSAPPEQPEYDPDVEEMISANKTEGISLRISNSVATQALGLAREVVMHGLTKWERIWKKIEEPFKEVVDIARVAVEALNKDDDKPTARPAGPGSDEVH